MSRFVKNLTSFILQTKKILFFVAVFNFVWFFSQSSIVHHFGSKSITFCYICPWYWDWSLTNLPSLSLFATAFLLFRKWQTYLAACIISSYQIIEGIIWASNAKGLLSGFQNRLEIISESILGNNSVYEQNFWTLLDVQYLFAVIIFITAIIYLLRTIVEKRKISKLD